MPIALLAITTSVMGQSLNKMNWLNEPQRWEIKEGNTLVMDVPTKTDFWRIWIKTGVEFVDGKQNVSTVVTHRTSDWSVVQLPDAPRSIWIKAIRRLDAVEIFYSRDDKEYIMTRVCWLQDNCPVMVGLMGACPDGKGFTAIFEEFKVTPLADQRRLDWAKKQQNK